MPTLSIPVDIGNPKCPWSLQTLSTDSLVGFSISMTKEMHRLHLKTRPDQKPKVCESYNFEQFNKHFIVLKKCKYIGKYCKYEIVISTLHAVVKIN